jgi:glycosyltransferase involved in cell wall biosynthesis
MRRVMIINTLYPPSQVGGAEKSVSILAEALVRAGDNVTVVSLHARTNYLDEQLGGVRVIRLPLDNLYWPWGRRHGAAMKILWHLRDMWSLKAANRIGLLIDEIRPDLVHTNNIQGFSGAVWKTIAKRGVPIVHTLRDYSLLCSRGTLFRNGQICKRRCASCAALTITKKLQSQRVQAVVSNSQYVIDAHKNFGYFNGGVPTRVIFNISDPPNAMPAQTDKDVLVFGLIGRLEPEKGLEIVLEASAQMKQSAWRLLIAGQGEEVYVKKMKARFPDKRISWLGQTNAANFYGSVDTTLIASIWAEPLPRTLIESMAYGRTTLCARSGGIPEIAANDSYSILYEPRDVLGLSKLMDNAVRDMEKWKQVHRPPVSLLSQFSESDVVREYRAVYDSVVFDNRSRD